MSPVRIYMMSETDLDAVHEIESSIFPQPWSVNLFRGELLKPDKRVYLAAKIDDKLVGYAGLMLVDGEAHITTMAVDTPYRGKRIGSLLALRIIEIAILKRVHWLTLEVRESNKAAQELYKKFGFKQIGIRQKYYSDSENAVIMWTNDIQSDEFKLRIAAIKKELS
ncbi:MAG: ribosomal protein S18-alanine N-acetyltransferase [Actinomycetota bacterium]